MEQSPTQNREIALGVKLLSRLILLALNIQCFEGEIRVGWVCFVCVVVCQADTQS